MNAVDERVVWLREAMGHIEQTARNSQEGGWRVRQLGRHDLAAIVGPGAASLAGLPLGPAFCSVSGERAGATSRHIALNDPRSVLARVAADRSILGEVTSWKHDYYDDDPWYSCAQAASTWEDDRSPGSGCSDDDRSGGPCDCGLDRRRDVIVGALLSAYRHVPVPGFQEEWMTGG